VPASSEPRSVDAATIEPLAAEFASVGREQWEVLVRAKDSDPQRSLATELEDGVEVGWLYTPADALAPDPGGLPGAAPFVRGDRIGKPWAIRQQSSAPTRVQMNREILKDLQGGATEVLLSVSADGSYGAPVSRREHLAEVLDGVHLNLAPVALDAGQDALLIARLLVELLRESGHASDELRSSLRIDPIGARARAGGTQEQFPSQTNEAMDLVAEVGREFAAVHVLAVDTTPYADAGAGAVLELALALATGVEYLRAADLAEVEPSALAATLEFTLSAGPDQFLEIAKFRAARRLWTTVLEHCGTEAGQLRSRLYAHTSRRMASSLDPWINLVRSTTAAFAAGVGGADGLTVVPFDEPVTDSGAGTLARRMARNTQLLLIEEAAVHRVADPAGGAWYVESLTDQLARRAWSEFQGIERDGGIVAVLASGEVAGRLAAATALRQQDLARRRRSMTGVNMFPLLGDDGLERSAPSGRDAVAVPPVKRTGGTGDALIPVRDGAQFEALRARAASLGHPRVVLVNVGPLAEHVNVNLWARSFFAVGGIETVSQSADQVELEGATVVAICAGRGVDPAPVIASLRVGGAEVVYLPGATREAAETAGADVGVRDGVDMVEILDDLLDRVEGMSR
jgi:methylmalonyl-CoA mutase